MAPVLWTDHGPVLNDETKHIHQCADGCGAFWVCGQRDGCDRAWICPNCEQERLDHAVTLMAEKEETNGTIR